MVDVSVLESVAQQLAARLREDPTPDVWAWLEQQLPDPADWFRLCFALAAAVPDNRTWKQLTRWCQQPARRRVDTRIDTVDEPIDTGPLPGRGVSPTVDRLRQELLLERYGPHPRRRDAA